MIKKEQVEVKKDQLKKELESASGDILNEFPIADYLRLAKDHLGYSRLSYLRELRIPKRIISRMNSKYDVSIINLYLKFALISSISDSLERLKHKKLPDEIIRFYHVWFENVLGDFSVQPNSYYHHDCSSFFMDIKICTLKYIPVGGAWEVEVSRVGFRPFIAGGLGQCLEYMKCLTFKTSGFTQFYVIHTVSRYISRFNKEEMDSSYRRIATLLKLNPQIKGIYRRSWFLDPNLEQVSPELLYLRQVPQQNGARFFDAGSKKRDIELALAMSPLRKKLYSQGKYLPTGYAYIWLRKDILEWSERTPSQISNK